MDCCTGRDQEDWFRERLRKQIGKAVERATAPHQCALSTRAWSECIAHVFQGPCEQNPQATVISIDGLGAFDQISRAAMLDGLLNVAHCGAVLPFVRNCGAVLPFVRNFYGAPSSYLWGDRAGTVHTTRQGEGGEQGDALSHFSLQWQHSSLSQGPWASRLLHGKICPWVSGP